MAWKGKALLFGLNYLQSEEGRLNGCINDVTNMAQYLRTQLRIPCDVYTDDKSPQDTTLLGMTTRLYELALQSWSEYLDFVWIHYSGHGSYVADNSRDELDGQDECLVPTDYAKNGVLLDDTLNNILKQFNPKTKVICIFDCCHSGTIADVKYHWETDTRVNVENIQCQVKPKVITLSGCQDTQTSADAYNVRGDNQYTGAMTSCLLTALSESSECRTDIFRLLTRLRALLKEKKFTQVPKLCSTYNLTRDRSFLPKAN